MIQHLKTSGNLPKSIKGYFRQAFIPKALQKTIQAGLLTRSPPEAFPLQKNNSGRDYRGIFMSLQQRVLFRIFT